MISFTNLYSLCFFLLFPLDMDWL